MKMNNDQIVELAYCFPWLLKQKKINKPHIQLIKGYWRVSKCVSVSEGQFTANWLFARGEVFGWNERRIRGM